MGYTYCRTCFHTITIDSIASRYFSTHIHMEVTSSSGRIEKFSERPGTISLREFKVTFKIVVYELEFKYGANYNKAFTFKQLARYVHYEALDVYKQHSSRILGITPIPNLIYATTIITAFQAVLQACTSWDCAQ